MEELARVQSVDNRGDARAQEGSNGNIATAISDEGEDLEGLDLDIEYVGLMPVAPMNPPGGLGAALAMATPAVAALTGEVDPATVAAVGATHGVGSRGQATQRCQANIAAGVILKWYQQESVTGTRSFTLLA